MSNSITIPFSYGLRTTESIAAFYDEIVAGGSVSGEMEAELGITLAVADALRAQPSQGYKYDCHRVTENDPGWADGVSSEGMVFCRNWPLYGAAWGNEADALGPVTYPSVLTVPGVQDKLNRWLIFEKFKDLASAAVRQNVPPDFSWIASLPSPEKEYAQEQVGRWQTYYIPVAIGDATPDKGFFQTPIGALWLAGVGGLATAGLTSWLAPIVAPTVGAGVGAGGGGVGAAGAVATVGVGAVVGTAAKLGLGELAQATTPDPLKVAPAARATTSPRATPAAQPINVTIAQPAAERADVSALLTAFAVLAFGLGATHALSTR